jgi:DNA-binding beta-propeller fold protein YncE
VLGVAVMVLFAGAGSSATSLGPRLSQNSTKLLPFAMTGTENFGAPIAVSADGSAVLVGGLGDVPYGAAWVFSRSGGSWTEQAKLLPTGLVPPTASYDRASFGAAVALSADGDTAFVSAPGDSTGGVEDNGAVWVFVRSGTTWTQQGPKLVPNNVSGSHFGTALAVSGDGNTLVATGNRYTSGAAWVFTRSGDVWNQQAQLTVSDDNGTGFGDSAAISRDGSLAAVGDPYDSSNEGAVWTFAPSGGVWTQLGPKLAGTAGDEEFGKSIALSGDGMTALIGTPGVSPAGGAFAFTRSGSVWTQQGAKLAPVGAAYPGEAGDRVALAADGNTAIFGAPYDNRGPGAAWIYARNGNGVWSMQGPKKVAADEIGTYGHFGADVALTADGNTAFVGGPYDDASQGAIWVLARTGTSWTFQGPKFAPSDPSAQEQFGYSVSLSADGATALVGGWHDNGNTGAAWVYVRSGGSWLAQAKLVPSDASRGSEVGSSVSLSADGETALIGGPTDSSSVGSAWVFRRSGGTWAQQGPKLTASDETGRAAFGASVSLSGDGSTAVIGGPGDNANHGAAWLFASSGGSWAQQGPKLLPSDAGGQSSFGASVAIASDAATLLVGGPNYRGAWVFAHSGGTWAQQGPRLGPPSGAESFGSAVALSADGNTALITGGGAWIYTRSSGVWSQGPTLTRNDGQGGLTGSSAALSGDGQSALVGSASTFGAAVLFRRSGSTWSQQGPALSASDPLGSPDYGRSVALSSDGTTAFVGGDGDNSQVGAAWAVTFTDSTLQLWGTRYTSSGDDTPAGEVFSLDGSTLFVTGSSGTSMVTIAYNASSGAVRWARSFGSAASEAIALSPDGSTIYVTAETAGIGGHLDYLTIAYDTVSGNQLWSKTYDSAMHLEDVPVALAVSRDGSKVFVTGTSDGGARGKDYATIAYDASTGAQLWAARFNSTFSLDDTAAAIGVSPDGSRVFVTGSSTSAGQARDYATLSYSTTNGAQQWVARFSSRMARNDDPTGLAVSPDGTKVFVTGESPGMSTATPFRATTFALATTNGKQLWEAEDFPEPTGNYRPVLALSPDGSTVFVADTVPRGSSLDFGTAAYATSTGNRRWTTSFNGPDGLDDSPTAIAVSPDGSRLYVTGSTGSPSNGKDFLTVAYSATSSFHFFWSRRNNGAGNGDDIPKAVAVTPDSSKLAVTGSSVGTSSGNDWSILAYRAG